MTKKTDDTDNSWHWRGDLLYVNAYGEAQTVNSFEDDRKVSE